VKLGIIATQADGGDTNAALLFDELVGATTASHEAAPTARPESPRSTTALLRAARAARPRITSHRSGRRAG
jgi:hypothetical protein